MILLRHRQIIEYAFMHKYTLLYFEKVVVITKHIQRLMIIGYSVTG